MLKLHYYLIPFLLGSLLAVPLYASEQKMEENDDISEDEQFIDKEDSVNLEELEEGLIQLTRRIKADNRRQVYFFIGAADAGKSLSILALQGNKIEKPSCIGMSSGILIDVNSHHILQDINNNKKSLADAQFKVVKYVRPKHEVPVVGAGGNGGANSTYIYCPDPKKPAYSGIAFAETSLANVSSFSWNKKTTNAAECLSFSSFFYAARANKIGGLVLVISSLELGEMKGKIALMCFADLLERYFGKKALYTKSIKKSILVMITKVDGLFNTAKSSQKLRKVIQSAYSAYYTNPDNADNHRLKVFFEMLLVQDVPEDKIKQINNFILDGDRYSFIFPWDANNVQHILDQKLIKLNPIHARDLCILDNPISQYMEARIVAFSLALNQAIQPLLTLKSRLGRMRAQLESRKNAQVIDQDIEEAENKISKLRDEQNLLERGEALEIVFSGSHNADNQSGGYSNCKAFEYTGKEPIYAIWARYGPGAAICEKHPYANLFSGDCDTFIEKHFTITINTTNDGSTWQAIAKDHNSVVKKGKWVLYHAVKGNCSPQCNIEFYTRTKDRIATQQKIADIRRRIDHLRGSIASYKQEEEKYCSKLALAYSAQVTKWETQRRQQVEKWKNTVDMLQFLKNEILTNYCDKMFITGHLTNYNKATCMEPDLTYPKMKEDNHQQNTLQLEATDTPPFYGNAFGIDADNNLSNDHQLISSSNMEKKEADMFDNGKAENDQVVNGQDIMDID